MEDVVKYYILEKKYIRCKNIQFCSTRLKLPCDNDEARFLFEEHHDINRRRQLLDVRAMAQIVRIDDAAFIRAEEEGRRERHLSHCWRLNLSRCTRVSSLERKSMNLLENSVINYFLHWTVKAIIIYEENNKEINVTALFYLEREVYSKNK